MSNGLAAGLWDQRNKLAPLEKPALLLARTRTARNFGVPSEQFEQLKLAGTHYNEDDRSSLILQGESFAIPLAYF